MSNVHHSQNPTSQVNHQPSSGYSASGYPSYQRPTTYTGGNYGQQGYQTGHPYVSQRYWARKWWVMWLLVESIWIQLLFSHFAFSKNIKYEYKVSQNWEWIGQAWKNIGRMNLKIPNYELKKWIYLTSISKNDKLVWPIIYLSWSKIYNSWPNLWKTDQK